jgi:hypothetical protein
VHLRDALLEARFLVVCHRVGKMRGFMNIEVRGRSDGRIRQQPNGAG